MKKFKKLTTAVLASVMAISAFGALNANAAGPSFTNRYSYHGISFISKHASCSLRDGYRFSNGFMWSNGGKISFHGSQSVMDTDKVASATCSGSGEMHGSEKGINKTWYF